MTDHVVASTGLEDIEDGSVLQTLIEAAAQSAASNFGKPSHIMMSPQNMGAFMGTFSNITFNPEFEGTGWDNKWRLTKRERKFAQVHVFLKKLRVLPNDDAFNTEIKDLAVKRLKRARWARYQQAKKV